MCVCVIYEFVLKNFSVDCNLLVTFIICHVTLGLVAHLNQCCFGLEIPDFLSLIIHTLKKYIYILKA